MMPDFKIAIASGKGGTGKTMVTTNLYYALHEQGYDSILVDCDAEEPNAMIFYDAHKEKTTKVSHLVPVIDPGLCTFCGKCREYCSYNAIFMVPPVGIIKVFEDLCHGCGACMFACTNGAITEKELELGEVNFYTGTGQIIEAVMKPGVASPVRVIKAAILSAFATAPDHQVEKSIQPGEKMDYKECRIILMDSPPGTSCPFIQTVIHADHVILVTEPTPFGLSDLKQSVETLKSIGKSYSVIINRAGMGDQGVYEYLHQENIPLSMVIPFNKAIAEYYSNGEIVVKHQPELGIQFLKMINDLIEKHGNSSYQR